MGYPAACLSVQRAGLHETPPAALKKPAAPLHGTAHHPRLEHPHCAATRGSLRGQHAVTPNTIS